MKKSRAMILLLLILIGEGVKNLIIRLTQVESVSQLIRYHVF